MGSDAAVTVAQMLAGFATRIAATPAALPPAVIEQAALRLLDNLGCGLFALQVEPAHRIAALAVRMGQGVCRVPGFVASTSPTGAALALGTLIQGFEMNDLGVYVHPGACVVPACLAALDLAGATVSGAALLAAMVVGYEVTVRLSECVGPSAELDVGWHTPPFHGAVGAAAAASVLLGSDAEMTAQALVIAADIAGGGLMLARLGSDVKRLHCGRGAEAGVLAALLAQEGIRSRLDTLEHPDWGYCRTITASTDRFDLAPIAETLGERYVGFSRTATKYYPVGAEVLGVIDSISALKRDHGFGPEEVEAVVIGTPRFFLKAEAHAFPRSVSEIHFNAEYGAAMALLYQVRPVYEGPEVLELWLDGYRRPEVEALARRVTHVVDEELERHNPYSVDSSVEIRLLDGRRLAARSGYVRNAESAGTMKFAAMDRDRMIGKFRSLTRAALPGASAVAAVETLLALPGASDAAGLWRQLAASVPTA